MRIKNVVTDAEVGASNRWATSRSTASSGPRASQAWYVVTKDDDG